MADTKTSGLSAAGAVGAADNWMIVQSGANKNVTAAQLATYLEGRANLAELIRDTIGSAVVAGTNITITVNDAGDTITFDAAAYTDEQARDAIGAALVQGAGVRIVVNDAGDTITLSSPVHPGYISGNWYAGAALASGAAWAATNLIRFMPVQILAPVTIQKLGVRVSTLFSGGKAQCALYARDVTTGRPTGSPILNSGDLSTTSAVTVASAALTNTAFTPGMYWGGTMLDNTTAALETLGNNPAAYLQGSATFADVGGTNFALSTTGTFGTWPDMTSVTPTAYGANSAHGAVFFQAA
jgi:hypothetical protein